MNSKERIDSLLKGQGFNLGQAEVNRVDLFCKELERWNAKINLTTITDFDDVVILHFADSFKLCRYLTGNERVLDIGSGAGFPGLAMKILLPELDLCSVEKVNKKQVFQKNIGVKLELSGITYAQTRIEELTDKNEMSETFDVVVSRAWTEPTGLLRAAKPFLKPKGRVLAMTGVLLDSEEAAFPVLAADLGYSVESQEQYRLPGANKEHVIRVLVRN